MILIYIITCVRIRTVKIYGHVKRAKENMCLKIHNTGIDGDEIL